MNISSIRLVFLSLSLSFFTNSSAQNTGDYNKGDIYSYWGWNWSWYTKSNIHFTGNDYDFILHNVAAQDRQTKFQFKKYFNPKNISIPQYNFRIGYFIKDNIDISFGIDHMKYVLEQNQLGRISGFIQNSGTIYDGFYDNSLLPISDGFLQFEHSDGLNYINFEIRKHHTFLEQDNIEFTFIKGVGLGFMLPKTNALLLNNERNDNFYLSGYGFHSLIGLNFKFLNNLFIQSEFKGGYTNLPKIRTTKYKEDRASQSFFFGQLNLVFGYLWSF
jgi:hypothetical protein